MTRTLSPLHPAPQPSATRFALLLGVLGVLAPAGTARTDKTLPAAKSDLRVLFVGHDPDAPQVIFPDMATERTYELYRERTPAFEAFLKRYFSDVRVVHAADYETEMSDAADVTVFDARPPEIEPARRERDPDSGRWTYEPARYLPDDFDHAALLIAENAPRIGEALGLKLDWL